MKITKIEKIHYENPIPVYDVVDVQPNHNFAIDSDGYMTIAHNCGFL